MKLRGRGYRWRLESARRKRVLDVATRVVVGRGFDVVARNMYSPIPEVPRPE